MRLFGKSTWSAFTGGPPSIFIAPFLGTPQKLFKKSTQKIFSQEQYVTLFARS
jgi:hypothetical protein